MSRPKGIPNKKKEPSNVVIATEGLTEKREGWKPVPDMGSIKPPAPKELPCADCGHLGAIHYGSERNWCNTSKCNCQGMK